MSIPLLVGGSLSEITINELLNGRANNTGKVTLAASLTTTTVIDTRVRQLMLVLLSPRTASAAAALTNVYVSTVSDGGFELTHASAASIDRTFDYVFHG